MDTSIKKSLRPVRSLEGGHFSPDKMVVVASHKYAWRLGHYYPEKKRLRWEWFFKSLSRFFNEEKYLLVKESGVVGSIGGRKAILFRYDDKLFLDYQEERVFVGPNVAVSLVTLERDYSTDKDLLNLQFKENGNTLLSIVYYADKPFIPLEMDTTFVGPSDFDFGIY
jgi:hypothetical protein